MQRILPSSVSKLPLLNGYPLNNLYIDFPLVNTYYDKLFSYLLFSLMLISFFLVLSILTRHLHLYLNKLELNFALSKSAFGFTLIELLVVIAIIAVLAVMGFAAFGGLTGKGNDARRAADMKAFADAMEAVRARTAGATSYTAPALTDFSTGTFPVEPTNRAIKYCYQDSLSAAISNPTPTQFGTLNAAGCPTAPGTWTGANGAAPSVSSGALYFKFCTINEAISTVICVGSRQ